MKFQVPMPGNAKRYFQCNSKHFRCTKHGPSIVAASYNRLSTIKAYQDAVGHWDVFPTLDLIQAHFRWLKAGC